MREEKLLHVECSTSRGKEGRNEKLSVRITL